MKLLITDQLARLPNSPCTSSMRWVFCTLLVPPEALGLLPDSKAAGAPTEVCCEAAAGTWRPRLSQPPISARRKPLREA